MRTILLQISILSAAFGIVNCSSDAEPAGGSGVPSAGSGGRSTSSAGGSSSGGAGGVLATGNAGNAGYSTGGTYATGGTGFGNAGNTAAGGTAFGGNPATGGAGVGGNAMGGTTGNGHAGVGGSAMGGTTGNGHAGGGGTANGGGGTGGGTSSSCNLGMPRSGGTQHCSNAQDNLAGGYSYQLWSSGTGTGCMTPYGADATFKANWDKPGDFLARVGLGWNSSQAYDQLGTIAADYAYTKTGNGGGFSFIGIYGWSENPLVEYYIVEDWFGSGPPTGGGSKMGTFSVDGGTYNVYQHTQTNQPAITGGNATFPQFFSVRQTPRQCGHISISEHFKEWTSLGMKLGKMEEARILVEVGGGTGSIDFTTATVTATK